MKKVFISYRNTIVDEEPENWNLVRQLAAELKSRDPAYKFTALPPEQLPLHSLSKQQRALLRICSLDFNLSDPWSRRYNMPYRKAMKHLLVVCRNCQRIYMVDGDRLKK